MEPKSEFAKTEHEILEFWRQNSIFLKSLEQNKQRPSFTFYDGPPFATGLPHYGHLLASIIKDVVPRYKTMKGFYVPRRFGWDCHGLPVENEVEKKLNLSGAASIEEYGIAKFNEECRSIVLKFTKQWEKTIERIGRFVDFSLTWKTMDLSFMETVWWVFKQVYEKGLIYEGFKVMPFSAQLGTPLSNFEAGENYKEVDDPSVVVQFALEEEDNTYLLCWTTTPWTLISNLGVSVGKEIDYVQIKHNDRSYILAKEAVDRWFKDQDFTVIKHLKGKDLVGKTYHPLFDYFKELKQEGAYKVIEADFVSTEDGTGLVHTAPAFGETDFYAGQKAGLPLVCPVDQNGRFTHQVPDFHDVFVKDADKPIIQKLKEKGLLFYRGTIRHRYPFCWRSDTPLIYRAMTTWFLKVEDLKDRLLAANEKIHWMPKHLKYGRFGHWLEGARDWAISRNRYWGTPIPIWRSDDGDLLVIGSIQELEEKTGTKVKDLHKHCIDDLTIHHEGKVYKRINEVFDCWFDAGSMPYAQNHYPFENKTITEQNFPADFIAEGVDQTRGWFYTLTILAVALFDKPAFKNVVVNGILLAEDGNKMSKRLKNYPEPTLILEKYGADAVRLYLLHSPAVKADDLRVSEKGIDLVLKKILIPLLNAVSFFETYQKIYDWQPRKLIKKPAATLDRWIVAQLHKLIFDVEQGMDEYDLSAAVEPFVGYIDQLTNWYIRRSRRRFWSDEATQDRDEAFSTLYTVLFELSKVCAPFIPFVTESIFRKFRQSEDPISVHLASYPDYDRTYRDDLLENGMDAVQLIVSLGHSLRKEKKIKVRQPLSRLDVVCQDPYIFEFLETQKELIAEELNVKHVVFHDEKKDFVTLNIRPNFRVLGKKVGKEMKHAQAQICSLDSKLIEKLANNQAVTIHLPSGKFMLDPEDVEIFHSVQDHHAAMSMGKIALALDTQLNEDLILEGIARELVNKINTMRRQANLAVTDRIKVHLGATDKVTRCLEKHKHYIQNEVLATEMIYSSLPKQAISWDINGELTQIFIEKN